MSLLATSIVLTLLSLTSRKSVLTHTEDKTPLEVNLATYSTLDSISISNLKISEYSMLYLYLSDIKLEPDYQRIEEKVLKSNQTSRAKTVDYITGNISVNFSDLQSNSTYFLYYFAENYLHKKRSELKVLTLKTNTVEVPIDETHALHLVSRFFAILMPSFFMFILFCFFKNFGDDKIFDSTPDDIDVPYQTCEKTKGCINGPLNSEFQQVLSWCKQLPSKLYDRTFSEDIVVPQNKSELKCQNQILEAENKEMSDSKTCGICCENPREVIFLSCGHVYCCVKCSLRLQVCPIDQKPIYSKYRFTVCDKYGVAEENNVEEIKPKFSDSLLVSLFGCSNSEGSIRYVAPKEQTPEEKYVELKKKNNKYKKYSKCVGCNIKKKDTVFLDCCHFNYCNSCAQQMDVCPLDRTKITRKQRAYIA